MREYFVSLRNLFVLLMFGLNLSPLTAQSTPLLLVSSSGTGDIKQFNASNGTPLGVFASGGGLLVPQGITIGPDGNVFVADAHSLAVYRYDGTTGASLPSPGNTGAIFVSPGSGGMVQPLGVAFGPDNNLYVTDRGTADGTTGAVRRYGGTTGAPVGTGLFANGNGLGVPSSLVFGPDGHLYVSNDTGNTSNSILRFNGATGVPLPSLGNTGAFFVSPGAGGLVRPQGLVFGPDGNLYVGGQSNRFAAFPLIPQVLRFNGTTGTFIDAFATANLLNPIGVAFGPDGNLYVGDASAGVLRFNGTNGNFIDYFAPIGTVNFVTYLTFKLNASPSLVVFPPTLSLTYPQGTVGPILPKTMTISSSGAPLTFTAVASTTPPGGTWLSVTPGFGTTQAILSVNVAQGLSAATYTGQITINASGASNNPQVVPVTLTVTPPPTGIISVTSLLAGQPFAGATFTLVKDGAFYAAGATPFSQSNVPAGVYSIKYNPVAGYTTPPNDTKILPAGGIVAFTGNYAPIVLSASPFLLSFSYQNGITAEISPQSFTVSNNGPQLGFTLSVATSTQDNWVSVTPLTGKTPGIIIVNVIPLATLQPGIYTASIKITAPNTTNNSVSVAVQLEVSAGKDNHSQVRVMAPGCPNDICLSFQSVHNNKNPNKAIGVLNITNQTGAWYELRVDYNNTTIPLKDQVPVMLLAPYGSFVTTTDLPFEFKEGDILQLVVNKNELDAVLMFVIDLTLRAFFDVEFPTTYQALLDFRIGSTQSLLGTIEMACAGDIASAALSIRQHDTFGIITDTADVAGCLATNPTAQAAIVNLIKLLYNDASGTLSTKWLKIAGDLITRITYLLSNGPKIVQLLGSEFSAADVTYFRLVATR